MSPNMVVMFNNAGLSFCYEKMFGEYSIVNDQTGKTEVSTYDALSAWTYYIERVDTLVRRRITAAQKKKGVNSEDCSNDD